MNKFINIKNLPFRSNQFFLGIPIVFFCLCFVFVGLAFPFWAFFWAYDQNILHWPAPIFIAFLFIYLVCSFCMLYSSMIWWYGFKRITSDLKNPSRYKSISLICTLSDLVKKWLVVGITLPGLFTLLICAFVFSDFDFYELFRAFKLHFLVTKFCYPVFGVKGPIIVAFLILMYLFFFLFSFLSDFFNFLLYGTKNR